MGTKVLPPWIGPSLAIRRCAGLLVTALLVATALAQEPADPYLSPTPERDAAGGCDGIKDGSFGFHTAREVRPWWQVDLGAIHELRRVLIYNRCDTASERGVGISLSTSPDGISWARRHEHAGEPFGGVSRGGPLTVALDGVRARFVRLQLADTDYMHLDEVEVFGAAEPERNLALGRPARQSSLSQWSRRRGGASAAELAHAVESGLLLAEDLRARGVEVGRGRDGLVALRAELVDLRPGERGAALVRTRALVRELALQNPLLDFDELLLVRRSATAPHLGLPTNWQGNSSLPAGPYDDALVALSIPGLDDPLREVVRPGMFVGDVDLDFDAERALFSSRDARGRWQVFEIDIEGVGLRQVSRGDQPDVDSYDACYLPDGGLMFASTAGMAGVPCVYGAAHVATLFRMDADGGQVRRLCFDQDHDWNPTPMADGRVLYTRWEYADTPHTHSRLLFTMNPDGTGQAEHYGSNSYWPNSIFGARPVPGHPSKLVGVVSGHHGLRRMGELVLFDPARGKHEAGGVVQRIPGRGQPVDPIIRDQLVDGSWPRFLHPWPLSEDYFLVAARPSPDAPWGVYLADTFDNLVLLREEPGQVLLEPIPVRPRRRPAALPSRVDLARDDASVQIADVYQGPGLDGVPRGTVKRLRVISYHFAYQGMGGLIGVLGIDGPWDVKRVLGTVPVEADGSVHFSVPAETPISVQPLDAEGKALQLMRSWMTAMPGETVSCVGCHDGQRSPAPRAPALALARQPSEIEPWYGPPRGFSYAREVQPVIDRHCLECHDGSDLGAAPDLRGDVAVDDYRSSYPSTRGGRFSVGYAALHRYVRRPGIESDYRLLNPMEFHANTTELVQMLEEGHHGVELDAESWDRLVTWIDLNTPFHGTWSEATGAPTTQAARRVELAALYGGAVQDPEHDADLPAARLAASAPVAVRASAGEVSPPTTADWAFGPGEARRRQAATGARLRRTVDLGGGVAIELALIPADELPDGRVEHPFWMATLEVTNSAFRRFDPSHDSRVEPKHCYQFGVRGLDADRPEQPVVRVSGERAEAFCRWLSERSGERFTLPTEEQWEHACRAGSARAFSFGELSDDFSAHANLADVSLRGMASDPYTLTQPIPSPSRFDDWIPRDERWDDGALIAVPGGRYAPNVWGLFDMHGNVAEWTRTHAGGGELVVRGGSWRDRPARATASGRRAYPAWQRVFDVGFRVVVEVSKGDAR